MSESDLPHVPGGRKRTGMHRRGMMELGDRSGYVLQATKETQEGRKGNVERKELGALRKN